MGCSPSRELTPQVSKERLQKVLAHAGVASRRKAEDLIGQGRVSVNGQTVRQLGTKVDPDRDEVRVDGQRVQVATRNTYLMVNKPRGVLSTMEDERGRRALDDLVQVPGRVYPVGRLDVSSEGLILLTDDGELANLLTHPRYRHEKEYRVLVNGQPSEKTLAAWQRGVMLDGKTTAPAKVDLIRREKDSSWLRIVMHEGRKRQVRRVAMLLGHPVRELMRVRLGPLRLGTLQVGQWRYLTGKELEELEALKRKVSKQGKRKGGRRGRRR
jgi:23S rRNA pseudouridine2605 synthase